MRQLNGIFFAISAWALAAGLTTGCNRTAASSAPAPPPFKPVVDVRPLMENVIDPAADVVWESVAIHITKAGEDHRQPRTDEEWAKVRGNAMVLAESGNLLMMAPRARDTGDWMTMSRALVDTASSALQATIDRDPEKLLIVGGDIDVACENCHKKYDPAYRAQ
jgi:hypothetical protein